MSVPSEKMILQSGQERVAKGVSQPVPYNSGHFSCLSYSNFFLCCPLGKPDCIEKTKITSTIHICIYRYVYTYAVEGIQKTPWKTFWEVTDVPTWAPAATLSTLTKSELCFSLYWRKRSSFIWPHLASSTRVCLDHVCMCV